MAGICDASRCDGRLHPLENTNSDASILDVVLTVSSMRCVSDLRIALINPQHCRFAFRRSFALSALAFLPQGASPFALSCFHRRRDPR